MVKPVMLGIVIGAFLSGVGCAQNFFQQIVPLKTTRPEVATIFSKEGIDNGDGNRYDLENFEVTVFYYNSRCPDDVAVRYNLATDTVIMVKVRPKGTLLVDNLLGGFYTNHTRKLTIENDLTFYLDTISGFGFLGLASAQAPDIAQMLYRLPIDPEIPGCLRTELDPAVRLVLEKEFYCDVLLK